MDTIRPPQVTQFETIRAVMVVPATPAPEDGHPVVFFGHGIGNDKEQMFGAAAEMAGKGIATVSIDWVSQGERQLPLVNPVARLRWRPSKASSVRPRFEAAITVSTRMRITRSSHVITTHGSRPWITCALSRCLPDCGDSDGCSGFQVNADKAGYLGLSVGGLIGQLTVAMSPEIQGPCADQYRDWCR